VEVKNNPAGRLHDLLELARQQNPRISSRTAWAAVFGVEAADTGALLKMLADLIDLSHETKSAIQRLQDVDHDIYLRPFKKIEAALSHVSFEAPWEHSKNHLDDQTLYGLKFASDRLARVSGYTQITADELDSLRQSLEQVLSDVLNSQLPQSLKLLFVRNIEALRHALLAYKIRGIEGLEEELARAVGSLVLHKDEIPPPGTKSPDRKAWESFFVLVDRFNKVVELAKNAGSVAVPAIPVVLEMLKLSS
jgi:hypothetical protein